MPEAVADSPFPVVFLFLLVVVFLRAQGTYWLGRAVAAGALRSRWADLFTGPAMARGTAALRRWGWPIIPLSFLTIGFQSAVNGAAGVLRMAWPRYTLAMIPGCVVWAAVYGAGGLAAFTGAAALAARSPWALAAVSVTAVGLVALVALRARERRQRRELVEALGPRVDDQAVDEAG